MPVALHHKQYRADMETWRDRMRQARKAKPLTQTQLAEILGVEQSTIAGWEGGRREPESLEMFDALADALDLHPATLLYGVQQPKTDWSSEEYRAAQAFIDALRDRAS